MNVQVRSRLQVLAVFALCTVALQVTAPVYGAYPDKPIRMIVPFPPGGSNDVLGRYVGQKLGERLGEQIVIDNRGGANGIIGAELAANSPANGYTLLMVSTSYVMNAAVRKLSYNVEKTFDPIATVASSPNCIVVHPGFVNTVQELVERARAQPGKILYGSTGVGGFNHFGGELFNKVAKVKLTMVAYKGGGPAMIDVMSGQIPMMFSSITQVLPHVRNGKLKIIAVGAAKRSPVIPDVPTVIESGFPGYEVVVWWGFETPAGVPAAIQRKLTREINAVVNDPEAKKRLLADAAEPLTLTPAQFRKMIHDGVQKWKAVADEAGIHLH